MGFGYQGGGGIDGVQQIDTVYTTAPLLEAGHPAASNDGMYAIVNGTTSDNGGYQSNGTIWVKIFDEPGDPTDLPDYQGGIAYDTVKVLFGSSEDEAKIDDNLNTYATLTGTELTNGARAFDDNDSSHVGNLFSGDVNKILVKPLNAPARLGKFTIKTENTEANEVFRIYGIESISPLVYEQLTPLAITRDNSTSGSASINGNDIDLGAGFTIADFDVTVSHPSKDFVAYGIKEVNFNIPLGFQIKTFEGFGIIDNTANITTNRTVRKLHRGFKGVTDAVTAGPLNLDATHNLVQFDCTSGAITANLPVISTTEKGKSYILKKVDSSSNSLTIEPNGAETIDGRTNILLRDQDQFVEVINNGGQWRAIGGNYFTRGLATFRTPETVSGTSHTLVNSNNGKSLICTNASLTTVTIDDGFTIPNEEVEFEIVADGAAGVSLAVGGSATINGGTTSFTIAQYKSVMVRRYATNNYRVYGDFT